MRLESVCPRQHLDSSKQRKKCLSCSPCPPHPQSYRSLSEIFSGEKMSPAFRIQYLPWLCSAFAGIHGLQQFWGSHSLPSQILTPLGPSPVLALYPNVTQRRQDSRWSMTAPIKATQVGSALTAPDIKGVLFLIPLFLSLKECFPRVDSLKCKH